VKTLVLWTRSEFSWHGHLNKVLVKAKRIILKSKTDEIHCDEIVNERHSHAGGNLGYAQRFKIWIPVFTGKTNARA